MLKVSWRRKRREIAAIIVAPILVFASIPGCASAMAQETGSHPAETVKIVVPFPAGGATDVVARLVGDRLNRIWKQPVIIENVAGATGAIGATNVARAAADGYTLLVGTGSVNSALPSVKRDLAFDTLRDFKAVSLLVTFPNVLVIRNDMPAKTTTEFIALLKANPGKFNFASSGFGSSIHLAGELFKLRTGTQMTHVTYRGSAPALIDLLAGHVDLMFDNLTNVLPHIQDGKIRALGVAGLQRTPFAPDIPAIAETLPGFEATTWLGFLAPAKLSDETARAIAVDVRAVMREPDLVERLTELAAAPAAGTPEEFAVYLKNDVEKWRRVVADAQLKLE